ncbi:Gfo/Idh/MocA family protein [Propionispora vibrioides]|uniref:Predicted dehydrogenase n=1 Tax=Propionispora vibrioides TaxID=112903 RepID=A0A1H8Y2C7_9FIRM|nr:Gfo/Idh/MocA family oxidoreductase [Propionispora vibrioides]SEP46212.1 Predicted dehydrogenase [Propionispora vibrioides]
MNLKYAVIGYGFIGRRHVKTLKSFAESDCVAVCDINPLRLKEVKELYPEIAVYDNADQLFDKTDVDGVIIAANNNQHKDLVIKAARAGKHIICEKPVAMSVRDLDEMVAEVEKAGVTFTVHQQRRFDKDFRSVKECYDQKMVGDIYIIKSSLYGFNGNMHDWHVFKEEGGGMLYDWGVHLIDQILYMVNSRLISVYADIRNVINKEVDDYFKIILRFENRVTAEIELGTYILSDRPNWFERHWYVGGNKGSMYADKFDPSGKIVRTTRLLENVPGDQEKSTASYGPTRSFGIPEPGLLIVEDIPQVDCEQMDYFTNYFKAIKGEEEFLVKIPEVRRVLSVMEACWKSARTMKSVDFE